MDSNAQQAVVDQRRKKYKSTVDSDAARRRREETSIKIRKEKTQARFSKRRAAGTTRVAAGGGGAAVPGGTAPGALVALPAGEASRDLSLAERSARIPDYVQMVQSADEARNVEGTLGFRKLLSVERRPPIQAVIDTGIVPILVKFLERAHNPKLQFEAAWTLTNIASGASQHTRVVVEAGATPMFIKLLDSVHPDVREQSVWAIGNIAGDSAPYRDMVLAAGAMAPILQQFNPTRGSPPSLIRNATWTLSNFCRGRPYVQLQQIRPCLAMLAQLTLGSDEEVVTDACWALSYVTDGTPEAIQAVIATGVTRRLCELLRHRNPSIQTPCLRSVGNIVTGDDDQTGSVIAAGGLAPLLELAVGGKRGIVRETCWALSNITAGSREQIQAVMEANVFPSIIKLMSTSTFDIRREACWVVANATSGGDERQIDYLVAQGAIPPLCEFLRATDAKLVMVALESLENILTMGQGVADEAGHENPYVDVIDAAGGVELMEGLQHHNKSHIYSKVLSLLTRFFEAAENEADDDDLEPEAGEQGFGFGVGSSTAMDATAFSSQQAAPTGAHGSIPAAQPANPFAAAAPAPANPFAAAAAAPAPAAANPFAAASGMPANPFQQ